MRNSFCNTLIIGIIAILLGCNGNGRGSKISSSLDTITLNYARNLTILKGKEFLIAELRNPWDTTKLLQRYILVPKQNKLPENLPNGTIVRTPISNAMVYTTIHCKVIEELNAINQIGGVCEIEYMNIPEIHKLHKEGKIIDAGKGTNPDIEKIIEFAPDAILLSPFENGGGYGAIEKLGTPIIECADYMESSALGGAEWIYFYGALFGKESIADTIFQNVETRYNNLKKSIPNEAKKPKLMYGLKSGTAWYVPAGESAIGKMLKEAGAEYIFHNTNGSGSIPMSFEEVFEKGEDSDVWLIRYYQKGDKTYSELSKEFPAYSKFQPFINKKIYGCNTSYSTYYEDFPFHPDMILKDIISLLYPNIDTEYKQKYYTPVKE